MTASLEISFLVKLYLVELSNFSLLANVVIITKLDILEQTFHSHFITNKSLSVRIHPSVFYVNSVLCE